jgi:hypothetical protein
MKPEQQRITIAEACGWDRFCSHKVDTRTVQYGHPPNSARKYETPLPDYLNDLNAMHEAIMSLTLEDQCNMLEILRKDVLKFTAPTITATAEQCLEAFLKTLNLWTP